MTKNNNIFAKTFFNMKIYPHVQDIFFESTNEVRFSVRKASNASIKNRLHFLRSYFPQLFDVEYHSEDHYKLTPLYWWYRMTFPKDLPEEKVKTWFYFILGDEEKTREFANQCSDDIFQKVTAKEKEEVSHTSTSFYQTIHNLSFAGRQVTFSTPVSENCYKLHDRISLLTSYDPWMHFIDYHLDKIDRTEEALQLHAMTFPDNIPEAHVKMHFYRIVGDKENFIKEKQSLNNNTSTLQPENEDNHTCKNTLPTSLLGQLNTANFKDDRFQQIIQQLNSHQQNENRDIKIHEDINQEKNITNAFTTSDDFPAFSSTLFYSALNQFDNHFFESHNFRNEINTTDSDNQRKRREDNQENSCHKKIRTDVSTTIGSTSEYITQEDFATLQTLSIPSTFFAPGQETVETTEQLFLENGITNHKQTDCKSNEPIFNEDDPFQYINDDDPFAYLDKGVLTNTSDLHQFEIDENETENNIKGHKIN